MSEFPDILYDEDDWPDEVDDGQTPARRIIEHHRSIFHGPADIWVDGKRIGRTEGPFEFNDAPPRDLSD